jgi:hypothetical protein
VDGAVRADGGPVRPTCHTAAALDCAHGVLSSSGPVVFTETTGRTAPPDLVVPHGWRHGGHPHPSYSGRMVTAAKPAKVHAGRLSQFPEVDLICVDSQGEISRTRLGFPTARAASTRIFSHVGRGIPGGGGDNDAHSNTTEAQAHRRGCLALARSGRAD